MTTEALDLRAPFALVASNRGELEAAHRKMIEWTKRRLERVDVDTDVETQSLNVARESGFLESPFLRRLNVLKSQRQFFEKILAALEAGYAIVPNFQMEVFAIRRKSVTPRGNPTSGRFNDFRQTADRLPVGAGQFVDPMPLVETETDRTKDASGHENVTHTQYPVGELDDEINFPLALAKPELMANVGRAIDERIFDEIGVARDTWDGRTGSRLTGDPILLGRILNPRRDRPSISFFLGWYFDPSRL